MYMYNGLCCEYLTGIPSNKVCRRGDSEVIKIHLRGLSGRTLARFGVYGNLQLWGLYMCVERLLLVQADLLKLLKEDVLVPRTEKYMTALVTDAPKGLEITITVLLCPWDSCKCQRPLQYTSWTYQDFPPQGIARCYCGCILDRCRARRAWAHLVMVLTRAKGFSLTRAIDPVDQRSLTVP